MTMPAPAPSRATGTASGADVFAGLLTAYTGSPWDTPWDEIEVYYFTNERWDELARLADISPPAANDKWPRRGIEVTVGIYRLRQRMRAEGALLPGQVRKELAAINGMIRDARERLRQIEQRRPVGWGTSFEKQIRILREVELELVVADDDVGTRPEVDARYLVRVLDGIWREFHGGKAISTSNKSSNKSRAFVEAVLRIADPDIGTATIVRAIKRARSRYTLRSK